MQPNWDDDDWGQPSQPGAAVPQTGSPASASAPENVSAPASPQAPPPPPPAPAREEVEPAPASAPGSPGSHGSPASNASPASPGTGAAASFFDEEEPYPAEAPAKAAAEAPASPPPTSDSQPQSPSSPFDDTKASQAAAPPREFISEKPVPTAALDALNKQITNRTTNMDSATRQKEAETTAAAKEYLNQQKTKREQQVTAAKSQHKQAQKEGAQKIDEYKKSGAVWSAVGMLVNLEKPNPYSKNTEHMRSMLSNLKERGPAVK